MYDGIQAIGELQNGALAATILTGLNIDEVIARTVNLASATQQTPIQTKAYLTDALGSIIAIARADQTPKFFYGYSPYGETQLLGSDPDNPANSIQYTARENDGIVGGTNGGQLYYYRARYYDPVLKRFSSTDPIGLLGGINVHAYAEGMPINLRDPLGLLSAAADLPALPEGVIDFIDTMFPPDCDCPKSLFERADDNYKNVREQLDGMLSPEHLVNLALGGFAAQNYGGQTPLQAAWEQMDRSRRVIDTRYGVYYSPRPGIKWARIGATWALNTLAVEAAWWAGLRAGAFLRAGLGRLRCN